jgi:serine/threonine protein kinase
MATNFAAMQFSRSTAALQRVAEPDFMDGETTEPTHSDNSWTYEQWLEALASGECDCETVIRGVRESVADNPDACWGLLALVDQFYRLHRIKEADFHNLNLLGQALLLKAQTDPEVPPPKADLDQAPQPAAAPPPVTAPAPPPTRSTVAVNDILRNRYRIDGILGRGGMGTVYAATDLYRPDYIPSDQRIALKVLHTDVVLRPGLLTELRGEFQCLQSLSHPNIVRVHEFDQDGDVSFFTMEQLTGAPLGRVIAEQRSRTLYRPYALAIIQQVGAAVAYAHSRGIVHGDLNPANIFITEWGEIRVLDFGAAYRLSRIQSLEAADETALRTSVATPSYASCEQLEGKEPTTEDDVYAMACITYVLLTGEHPFQGRNALAARQGRQALRRPEGISHGQWRALKAGLSFDPKSRPADMQKWLDRLSLPPLPPRLPSLLTIMSERRPPKRIGPPLLTALIALLAGGCWWAQVRYDWLGTGGPEAPIRATQAAVQPTVSDTPPSITRPVRVSAAAAEPAAAPQPTEAATAAPAPRTAAAVAPPPVARAAPPPASSIYPEGARIELAASTLDLSPMQPVASVVVSRRHNYHQEVSFTWSTESGTAKPGQDFMPVKSRTEFIAPGAAQTRLLVPIVENPRRHLSRTFYVVVNTPGEGATLGTRTITQVTIPASE